MQRNAWPGAAGWMGIERAHARDVAARSIEAGDKMTGSSPLTKTIGIVVVAALATYAAGLAAKITAT